MKLFRFLLRITVGGLFFGHGTHKLFGWFGGRGLDATAGMFEQLGLRPGRRNAIAAGISEAGGGAALALGLATPFASAALIGTMLTAIHRVHLKKGPWLTDGGYEYNLVLILAVALVAELGPGPVSVDHLLGTEESGAGWALAALVLGGAGAVAVHELAKSGQPPAAVQPAPEAPPARAETPQPAGAR